MAKCNATYSTTLLPINPGACAAACAGVDFTVQSVSSTRTPEGNYEFKWTVTREKTDAAGNVTTTTFADEAVLSCPDVKEITFYCDVAKNCPRFKLTLMCIQVQSVD